VQYRSSLRTTRMQAVRDDVDSGTATGASWLEVCTTAFGAVLAVFPLDFPASSVSGDVLTFSGLPKTAVALASGTAAAARVKNSDGTVIINSLTVGTSATDIIISPSTTITAGQDVDWTAGTITHP
jgi:hypothetical protein